MDNMYLLRLFADSLGFPRILSALTAMGGFLRFTSSRRVIESNGKKVQN